MPLNPKSQKALDAYLVEREKAVRKNKLQTHAMFFAVRNRYNANTGDPINVRSIHRMLLQITKMRGLQPMHPHLLRHACATHMLDNGCPLDVISHILGHDSLDVTAHYAQVSTRLMGHPGHRAGKSAHIPDEKFRASFGRQHTLVINRPVIVEGRPRFQFVGYWFEIIDPWPVDWLYTDDCYIDLIDGEYFLFNARHPSIRVLVFVIG